MTHAWRMSWGRMESTPASSHINVRPAERSGTHVSIARQCRFPLVGDDAARAGWVGWAGVLVGLGRYQTTSSQLVHN